MYLLCIILVPISLFFGNSFIIKMYLYFLDVHLLALFCSLGIKKKDISEFSYRQLLIISVLMLYHGIKIYDGKNVSCKETISLCMFFNLLQGLDCLGTSQQKKKHHSDVRYILGGVLILPYCDLIVGKSNRGYHQQGNTCADLLILCILWP